MKKFINNIIKKFKKAWKKDCRDILVPIISLIIFVLALFSIGFIRALIIFVLINVLYFIINKIRKKDKNLSKRQKSKKRKKRFKVFLLIILTCFIFGIIGLIIFFNYIVANAPEFNEELLYVSEPTVLLDKNGKEFAKLGLEQRVILEYDEIDETGQQEQIKPTVAQQIRAQAAPVFLAGAVKGFGGQSLFTHCISSSAWIAACVKRKKANRETNGYR